MLSAYFRSLKSRFDKSVKEYNILCEEHRKNKPTQAATIKFSRPVSLKEYRSFFRKIRERVRRFTQGNKFTLSLYTATEVDESNKSHIHVLIRSNRIDAGTVLKSMTEESAASFFGGFWHSDIHSVDGHTRYVVKATKDVFL